MCFKTLLWVVSNVVAGPVNDEYHASIQMNRGSANREAWHPQTREDRDEILGELREILASPHFCNSKRYPSLLKYIVENTLAGKSELLKERTLGIEVFERAPTYDTNADTVVRYTAGEVRKRLLLYYSEAGRRSRVQILLPAGSYIPEFALMRDEAEELTDQSGSLANSAPGDRLVPEPTGAIHEPSLVLPALAAVRSSRQGQSDESGGIGVRGWVRARSRHVLWLSLALVLVIAAIAGLRWKFSGTTSRNGIDEFWGPVLHDQRSVLICTGSVIFAPKRLSGTLTAGKDIEYPFVSMEGASAISLISGLLQSSGATMQLQSAGATPLSELREHSVVLIGGYNNLWTIRLLQPLRFYFTPDPVQSIVDRMNPRLQWSRDPSLPYSSADDFALLARYRDATTGSWVVVIAGLGRNGTEAAAQFATSPHYMQMLKDQIGMDFSNRNIEAVLRVRVIEGKTGAPSILAVHSQ